MTNKTINWYIGTSGFSYNHWRGIFYPADLPINKRFPFYMEKFSTVEINATFYRNPSEKLLEGWYAKTPPDFKFAIKVNRLITHQRKLVGIQGILDSFIKKTRRLKEKLAVLLYQLPPSMKKENDFDLLADFLKLLPSDLNHTIEFRHDSWSCDEVFDLLKKFNVAYCIVSAPQLKCCLQPTAPFTYIRMHGITDWYAYNYTESDLKWWAKQISQFIKNRLHGYIYFNNDYQAFAPSNAQRLKQLLKKALEKQEISIH